MGETRGHLVMKTYKQTDKRNYRVALEISRLKQNNKCLMK